MSVRDDYHRQGREMEDGAGDTIERYRRVSQDAIAPLTQEALFAGMNQAGLNVLTRRRRCSIQRQC